MSVLGGGGGEWGLGAVKCETVEMTRDCCEKNPFKSVMCCCFPFRHSDKKEDRKGSA